MGSAGVCAPSCILGFIVLKLFLAVPTLWWCSTSATTAAYHARLRRLITWVRFVRNEVILGFARIIPETIREIIPRIFRSAVVEIRRIVRVRIHRGHHAWPRPFGATPFGIHSTFERFLRQATRSSRRYAIRFAPVPEDPSKNNGPCSPGCLWFQRYR